MKKRCYAEREGDDNGRFCFRYPLREWGWKRGDCEARIRRAGLPVPRKSSCYFCTATKPHELHDLAPTLLRRIVLIEARAKPRLRRCEGLWRSTVKGCRGATPHPGAMTDYIRDHGLLPAAEVEAILRFAADLADEVAATGQRPPEIRPRMTEWLERFDLGGPAAQTAEVQR